MKAKFSPSIIAIKIILIFALLAPMLDWDSICKGMEFFKIDDQAKAYEIVKGSRYYRMLETATPDKIIEKAEYIKIYNFTYKPLRWVATVFLFVLCIYYYYCWKERALGLLFLVLSCLWLPIEKIQIRDMGKAEWNILDISLIVFLIILLWRANRKTSDNDQETPKEIQEQK